MGDRALVIFKHQDNYSPVTYLHWHGSDVPQLLWNTREWMVGRENDLDYTAARFVGVCHRHIDGNCSLGIWNLPSDFKHTEKYLEEMSQGNAGVIIVDVSTWEFEQYGGYELEPVAPLPSRDFR